jgi:hypothetical protein
MTRKRIKAFPQALLPNDADEQLKPEALATINADQQLRQLIAKAVDERVSAVTVASDDSLEPFFQPKSVTAEMRRRQSVLQQQKWHYYFEDWGCLICATTAEPHGSLGMCRNCYGRISERLKRTLAKRAADPREPVPTFTDTMKLARAALAPSLLAVQNAKRGQK